MDGSPRVAAGAESAGGSKRAASPDVATAADNARPPDLDDWDMDDRLGDIRRKLMPGRDAASSGEEKTFRRDAAQPQPGHVGPPAWHCAPHSARRSQPKRDAQPAPQPPATSSPHGLLWFVLALGLMALVCGGVLLGWSVVTGRSDLWNRGIPFAIGGQVALLFGLILQLERIWRDSRRTATRLEHVDEELHGLKSTTAMLGTTHSSAASSFYCHMAGGANSQLLLNDLKGQLDMLALKIGQEENRRG